MNPAPGVPMCPACIQENGGNQRLRLSGLAQISLAQRQRLDENWQKNKDAVNTYPLASGSPTNINFVHDVRVKIGDVPRLIINRAQQTCECLWIFRSVDSFKSALSES